ncbi:MAG: hypothetical protein KA536_11415 [Saprospiraceae bacterium]|nr:hypothetical protein [Saprospiraceae bacterium]
MQEFSYFKFEDREELSVAILGISASNWTSTNCKEFSQNRDKVIGLMRENRYDIIPSKGKSESIDFYVCTKNWGEYEDQFIEQRKIDKNLDVIYYLTHARDTLRLMRENNRYFYFLGNHKEILGLITIADFNDKHFYFWLYKKLVKLEKGLADFIQKNTCTSEIIDIIEDFCKKENDDKGYFSSVYGRYQDDKKNGIDTTIWEYLYLGQFCELVKTQSLYKKIGLTKSKFESGLKSVFDIRNQVAHPSKSILKSPDDLDTLWKAVDKIEFLTSLLSKNHED